MTDQHRPTDAQIEDDLRRSFQAATAPAAPETIAAYVARLAEAAPEPGVRWTFRPSLVFGVLAVAVSLALVGAVLFGVPGPQHSGPYVGGLQSPSPGTSVAGPPSAAPAVTTVPPQDLRPIPLPLDTFSGTVRDPSEATLSLVDALKVVRALTNNVVGPDPVARYMLLTNNTYPSNGGFKNRLVWVFVADDVEPIRGKGLPTTNSPPPYLGTLSWTIIDMNGHLLAQMQNRYFAPYIPPTLPRSMAPTRVEYPSPITCTNGPSEQLPDGMWACPVPGLLTGSPGRGNETRPPAPSP